MKAPKEFDTEITRYSGLNAFGDVTTLAPGEFRVAKNIDIYGNEDITNRRGSESLSSDAYGVGYKTDTRFAVGDDEYLISQVGSAFYSQKLVPTVGNPTIIASSVLTFTMTGGYLSHPVINGMTPANSTQYKVYINLRKVGAFFQVDVFRDAAKTQQVGAGAIADSTPLPATINFSQSSTSGLSGSFQLELDPGGTTRPAEATYLVWNAGTTANDIKNANQKVFCFSQEGNSVIEWNAVQGRFQARPMGLEPAFIEAASNAGGSGLMPKNAGYYYGLEKVSIENGADIVASSPNRRFADGTIPVIPTIFENTSIYVLLGMAGSVPDLENDPYWTHLRLWRSKSTTASISDPLFPIDAQGVSSELYEVALVSRAEVFGAFAPVSTASGTPAGNANTSAGDFGGGLLIIEDGSDDSFLTSVVGLDRIDLVPIPPARTGAVHAGRIFVSGINQDDIDPDLAEDVLYTTEIYSAYQEQWDPQAFLNAGRNSYKTTMLYSFGDDLLIIREGETRRVPSGNPDAGIQMVDDRIGVQTFLMAGFVTGLGIAAVCSDRYFRYLGVDLRWHSNVGPVEASNSIHPYTKVQAATAARFAYINGKLLMLLIDQNDQTDYGLFALAVKEGKGWSEYDYRVSDIVTLFTFSDGLRAAILPAEENLVEIEVDTDTDTDLNDLEPVSGSFEIAPFRAKDSLIDVSRFSFWGKLTRAANVTAKSSTLTWQLKAAFEQPGLWAANPELNERNYFFEPEPQTVGVFKWVPLRGQFISFLVETSGRFMVAAQRVIGKVRPANGNLGVFQTGGIIPQGPGWANQSLLLLNFEDPAGTFYDASGKGFNYEWAGSGSKTNRVAQKPGMGVRMDAGGYAEATTDSVSPLIGSSALAFKAVVKIDQYQSAVFSGKNGSFYYKMTLSDFGSPGSGAEMLIHDGETLRRYYADVAFLPENVYAVTFVLGRDFSGQFYTDSVTASSFFGKRPTVRTSPTGNDPTPSGASASLFQNLTLGGTYAGQPLYGTLSQSSQFWVLYSTEEDRTNEANPVGYFSGPPTGDTFAFTAQNGSGITGSVDVPNPDFPWSPENLDVIAADSPPADGAVIQVEGVVSYFEVVKSLLQPEQAKRFWGTVKAY